MSVNYAMGSYSFNAVKAHRRNKTYKGNLTKYRREKQNKELLVFLLAMIIILSGNYCFTTINSLANRSFYIEVNHDALVRADDSSAQAVALVMTDGEAESIKLSANPTVEDKIRAIAKEQNFRWPDYLVKLAKCESSLNPNAINTNKNGTSDKGLFQINDVHGLSDDFRYDIEKATLWTIEKINQGQQHIWVCDKYI